MNNPREFASGKAVKSLAENHPQELKKVDQTWENVELTDDGHVQTECIIVIFVLDLEFEECCTVPGEDGKDFVSEEWRQKRHTEPWAELQVQFLR